MNIQRCEDRAALRVFMNTDAGETAYALGDLEAPLWDFAEFWGAYEGRALIGIALVYHGFAIPALCLHGSPAAAEAILGELSLPAEVFCLCPERFRPTVAAHYDTAQVYPLLRMVVTPQRFRAAPHELPNDGSRLIRLSAKDVDRLNALYAQAADPGEEVLAFSPTQVELGVFYGIERDETLIAAAGTHIVSPTENIGAVGNVFTQPSARGRGLGSLTTSAVTQTLFESGITRVVLNVKADNITAQRVYQKLGFAVHCRFIEGPAQRL